VDAIVPTAALPEEMPFTAQVTVAFDTPVTVAVNGCALPARIEDPPGEINTL